MLTLCQVSLLPLVNLHISLIIFLFNNFLGLALPSDKDFNTSLAFMAFYHLPVSPFYHISSSHSKTKPSLCPQWVSGTHSLLGVPSAHLLNLNPICCKAHLFFFFNWSIVDLLNVVPSLLYSRVTQLYTYVYSFFNIPFHYDLSQETENSSLCYTVEPCSVSILNVIIVLHLCKAHLKCHFLLVPQTGKFTSLSSLVFLITGAQRVFSLVSLLFFFTRPADGHLLLYAHTSFMCLPLIRTPVPLD